VATRRLAFASSLPESWHDEKGEDEMSERQSAWKQALQEPNAIGWIGLIIVVIAIGFGAIYFGGNGAPRPGQPTVGQAVE